MLSPRLPFWPRQEALRAASASWALCLLPYHPRLWKPPAASLRSRRRPSGLREGDGWWRLLIERRCLLADSWTILERGLNSCGVLEGGAERSGVSRPVWDLQGPWGQESAGFHLGCGGGGRGSSARVPGQASLFTPGARSGTGALPGAPQLCQVGVAPERAGAIPVGHLCPEEEEVQAS